MSGGEYICKLDTGLRFRVRKVVLSVSGVVRG